MSGALLRAAVLRLGAAPNGEARSVGVRLRRTLLGILLRAALRRRSLPALLAALDGAGSAPAPDASGDATPGSLRAWNATCLERALAGWAALRARGADARFVIGVRPGSPQLLAHAWLEVDGRPVDEREDPRATWTVAFAHPGARGRAPKEESMAALRTDPEVILTELHEGTGVLLHLGTKFYYALNRTGVLVWKLVSSGEAVDADGLARALADRFAGTTVERARADVDALLAELRAEGLLAAGDGP